LDDKSFDFYVDINRLVVPAARYEDGNKIFAVSDIESGYRTFRDLLITHKVIDKDLNWTFGNGHLVLVGDFVDRGFSTTQVLWFIYRLEQIAEKQGGMVHFIIGNHEIKNMQANYESAAPKYPIIAYILGKQLHELYNDQSLLGQWMAKKNTMELINGFLFVHGGIHPDLANIDLSIDEINTIIRKNYRKGYFPKREKTNEQLLISTHTGPAWYIS